MPDGSSSADEERLPPGGFSLRHGFPQWFRSSSSGEAVSTLDIPVFKVLEYMRAAFNDEAVLDSIPLESAANAGAYHARHTYLAEQRETQKPSNTVSRRSDSRDAIPRARRPQEWNWQGVWEQRVQKGIRESLSEPVLFGFGNTGDEIVRNVDRYVHLSAANSCWLQIRFSDLDEEATKQVLEDISRRSVAAT